MPGRRPVRPGCAPWPAISARDWRPSRERSGIFPPGQRPRLPGGHAEIEDDLEAAGTRLTLLASLALTGDPSKGGEVLPRLDAWGHRFADTYKALNRGAHAAHEGDLGLLTGDARRLAGKIRGMLS